MKTKTGCFLLRDPQRRGRTVTMTEVGAGQGRFRFFFPTVSTAEEFKRKVLSRGGIITSSEAVRIWDEIAR